MTAMVNTMLSHYAASPTLIISASTPNYNHRVTHSLMCCAPVFVFYGIYASSLPYYWSCHPLVRLSHAYRRAGAAMAVTSFTSAAAFAANMISSIPAVRVFGMFLAIMVSVNYVLVLTWFPSCVAFLEVYVVKWRVKVWWHWSRCCQFLVRTGLSLTLTSLGEVSWGISTHVMGRLARWWLCGRCAPSPDQLTRRPNQAFAWCLPVYAVSLVGR